MTFTDPLMPPHGLSIVSPTSPSTELELGPLFRVLARRWRQLVTGIAAGLLVGLGIIFIPPRKYDAPVTMAAIPNMRGLSSLALGLSGGLGALLASGQLTGVQATPYFVAKLLSLRGVVTSVALSRVDSTAGASSPLVIERVMRKELSHIKPERIEPEMRKIIDASVDKQTGLIELVVTHRDSALARLVATRLLAVASKQYVDVARAQASLQRAAQLLRVDSAQHQLRRAQQSLVDFLAANRTITPYSEAAVMHQRLERDVSNAGTVYSQAITDREAAVARELEDTPAVVIVDPMPQLLTPASRNAALKLTVSALVGLLVALGYMAAKGDFAIAPNPPA